MAELWTPDRAVNVTMIADPSAPVSQRRPQDGPPQIGAGNRMQTPMPPYSTGYSSAKAQYNSSTVGKTSIIGMFLSLPSSHCCDGFNSLSATDDVYIAAPDQLRAWHPEVPKQWNSGGQSQLRALQSHRLSGRALC